MNPLWTRALHKQNCPVPSFYRLAPSIGRWMVAGVVLSGLCSSAHAQPVKPKAAKTAKAAKAAPVSEAVQQRREFLTRFQQEVKTNAAGAMTEAEQFLTEHPDFKERERIQFIGDIAITLYSKGAGADKAANGRTALALLQQGLEQYPVGEPRLYLVQKQAEIQRGEGDLTGSQLTMETNWPLALRAKEGRWSRGLLQSYQRLLRAQKRPAEIAEVTRELIEARPEEALHWWTRAQGKKARAWYGDGDLNRMIEFLLQGDQREEALRWAKLGWQVSEFSNQGITGATGILAKAWTGPDLDLSVVRAFGAAQKDASAPNPLREVALPTWDKTGLRRALKNTGDESAKVTLLIADERLSEALAVAQRMIQSDPLGKSGAAGVRGVAQVFKAHDLNTVRANAFVKWISKPDAGVENPLPALASELAAEAKPAN